MKKARMPVGPTGNRMKNTVKFNQISTQDLSIFAKQRPDVRDHQLEKTALGDLNTAKMTASMYATPRSIVVVEEKRRWSDGCRKSLYGARLTGAIFAVAHPRGKSRRLKVGDTRDAARGRAWFEEQAARASKQELQKRNRDPGSWKPTSQSCKTPAAVVLT